MPARASEKVEGRATVTQCDFRMTTCLALPLLLALAWVPGSLNPGSPFHAAAHPFDKSAVARRLEHACKDGGGAAALVAAFGDILRATSGAVDTWLLTSAADKDAREDRSLVRA